MKRGLSLKSQRKVCLCHADSKRNGWEHAWPQGQRTEGLVTARALHRCVLSQRRPGCGFVDDLKKVDSALVAHRHIKSLCLLTSAQEDVGRVELRLP